MKKILYIIVAACCLCVFNGCASSEGDSLRDLVKEKIPLEFCLYYEEGDERAGQLIAQGETIRYTYNGKNHCPKIRTFYQEKEIFTHYKPMISIRQDKMLKKYEAIEKGTYQILVYINYSDIYVSYMYADSPHSNFWDTAEENTYTLIVE